MRTAAARRQKAYRDRVRDLEKARAEFIARLWAAAPEGFGKRVTVGIEDVDGEQRAVIDLPTQEDADFINEYAAGLGIDPNAVLRELATIIGKWLLRGAKSGGQ